MKSENNLKLQEYIKLIESRMYEINSLKPEAGLQQNIIMAMNYSLSAGGKRLRPVLTMEFCGIFCGDSKLSLDTACAIEMLHTFSLIHDDLPCMDNDDLRRGKPSCHIAYGEAVALLAGDALAVLPFEIIASDKKIQPDKALKVISDIACSIGTNGMIGGQIIDIEHEGKLLDKDILTNMYYLKTCSLIKTACCSGAIIGGATEQDLKYVNIYAEKMGLAFQIIDDILDITGNVNELGKPIGSDSEQSKYTYATVFGIDEAVKIAESLTNEAIDALKKLPDNDFLIDLTMDLLKRKK